MTETILVTGGAGYIGSHACKVLAHAGFVPVTYDSLVNGHERAVRWGPLERGDLLDGDRLAAVLCRYRPAAVMHFAAYAYVGESASDPGKYYRNNVAGTLTLLDAMRAAKIDRLVYSSSCATYGAPDSGPINEDYPQHPVNPYGRSKHMIEQILSDFGRAYGLRSIALRYFNAAGADPAGDIGENHDPETHLIPLVLRAASDPFSPVTVWGTDYPTADGTCIRDYVHVQDLVNAHLLALRQLERASGGLLAFNLGAQQGHSVREIIDAAKRVTGCDIPVIKGPRRSGDAPELVADSTRAHNILEWHPQWNKIDAIIETAWRWHNNQRRYKAADLAVPHSWSVR